MTQTKKGGRLCNLVLGGKLEGCDIYQNSRQKHTKGGNDRGEKTRKLGPCGVQPP